MPFAAPRSLLSASIASRRIFKIPLGFVLQNTKAIPIPQAPKRFPPLTLPSAVPYRGLATQSTGPTDKMKALVYAGNGKVALEERPKPTLSSPTDAIVKLKYGTICGTDLHIIKGDVPTATPGRILGHEGVGIIEEVGSNVTGLSKGDTVLIACITACGSCSFCRKGMSSHCSHGGWILGNTIDGTQAEYVRIPCAMSSLYKLPPTVDLAEAVMLSDALPTGFECGTLNSKVRPGSSVAIVGAGPVGLAAMKTAQLYSPAKLVLVDLDDSRLQVGQKLGATHGVNPKGQDGIKRLLDLTPNGQGFDAVMEAVGIPATFQLCQEIVGPGGVIANIGVHGTKVDLHLEKLWSQNISITTRLVDATTIPELLTLFEAKTLNVSDFITHRYKFADCVKAYDTFKAAAQHQALKVSLEF
ncbi:alcohol dehydrogenase [Coccidioides immitis RS]|uniref:Alcohol dehydrogenase n=4 Tax=Coccidioides immitis TaxID=5501 RepID=J3K0U3_COCIM|nr:alcohol dehydrogenase [Coccidioides immitis RS]KMP09462.1 2-deoxy-scyllo-inosamine dehydrogenase [Coccidioides immitis RMSCC 2394]KMU78455.1 2-deoxy-scyllo-inosamine dehydrogenase [Coccidioides immitis RMSCC 3703]KMU88555.1 2-deoxy-scyllo-inosamine dehydrogenase [Coccidioides immitis H538.4]TPX20273.1 hypothetical protein DIZ76_016161 [Coccidioides immitis]EAS27504.3 alcohol dehydrogenase [Coccidioides immitis RS]